jgi:hypothetical protein
MAVIITFVGLGRNATTLIIMTVGITTFSVMTLDIKSLSVTTFSITIKTENLAEKTHSITPFSN